MTFSKGLGFQLLTVHELIELSRFADDMARLLLLDARFFAILRSLVHCGISLMSCYDALVDEARISNIYERLGVV